MTLSDGQTVDLVAAPVLERVLHEALRRGGDFAEVFAEDRSTLIFSTIERWKSCRAVPTGARVSGSSLARQRDSPIPPTCRKKACCPRPRRRRLSLEKVAAASAGRRWSSKPRNPNM